MPSLVQLQYALAVADHRHFGHAAQACHVTQPTLSQQLQKLEESGLQRIMLQWLDLDDLKGLEALAKAVL